jgi:hypothetical protein
VTVWIEPMKMVAISSALWLLLCVIAILLVSVSERSFLLFTPAPKWPAFLMFALLGGIAMKAGYWWVFERVTFYGSR